MFYINFLIKIRCSEFHRMSYFIPISLRSLSVRERKTCKSTSCSSNIGRYLVRPSCSSIAGKSAAASFCKKKILIILATSPVKVPLEVCVNLYILYEPRHEKMCLRESPTRQDTNCPAQLQRQARILKFRIYKLDVLFCLGSEQQRR